MGKPTRLTSHGTFFISTQTANRRRLFQSAANAHLFLETLQHYRREGHYRLHAFVVMPDHIHLLLTPHASLERAVGLIKGGFAHRLASPHPVWQRSFTDHRVRDREDFLTHRTYLHHNPVRARLCQLPTDYPFSSANLLRPVPTSPHVPGSGVATGNSVTSTAPKGHTGYKEYPEAPGIKKEYETSIDRRDRMSV